MKLIDFGIAQTALTLSRPHKRGIKGRIEYMAPEQVLGAPVDHRADLFSVGAILWEAAVGKRLWHGLSDAEITQRLLSGEPAPHLPKGRGFPPGLASVCGRALAMDPELRPYAP